MKLSLTIDRIESENAVLKTEEGETIIWPIKYLPAEAHDGFILEFEIQPRKVASEMKRREAKELLNELLNTEK